MGVIGSWPPSCPQHRMMSPSLLSNFQPYLYHPVIPENNQLVMPDDDVSIEEGTYLESISPQLTYLLVAFVIFYYSLMILYICT